MPPGTCYLCKRWNDSAIAIPVFWVERVVNMLQLACVECAEEAGVLVNETD